jgi:hypothetical protein
MDHCSCASLRGEKPGELPIQANGADEGGIGDLIVTLHLAAANRDFF